MSYVIDDPAGGHFYRLSESARFFLGLLDGRRTVDQAWEACLAQLGDDAPSQKECLELLAQMQLFGLLVGDQPIAPDMVPERLSRFRRQRLKQRTGNWMFYNIPLINPEPMLRALEPYLRVLWGTPGFVLWLVSIVSAIAVLIAHGNKLSSSLNGILDPANLVWLGVLFLVIRAVHEFGHAMACKAMGGRCTEIGVMLIAMMLPLPYCDATSSWKFPETRKRVIVACGGMLIETFMAAIATFVWAFSEAGLPKTLAFNTMVISGISTILFNANPLLRYDGYYILCDVAGSPNLAQRARQLWIYLIQKKLFGVPTLRPPYVRDRSESWLMLVYHLLAMPYRILITLSILMIVSTKYLSLGLVLAVVFGILWLVWPVAKGVWFMLTSPVLMGRRSRSWGVVAGVFIPLLLLFGIVPLPDAEILPAVVESPAMEVARVDSPGYVAKVIAIPGQQVKAGDVLVEMENPSLLAEAEAARARKRYALATLDDAASQGAASMRIAQARLDRTQSDVEDHERQIEALTIRAHIDGTFAPGGGTGLDIENLIGRFLDRGMIVGVVIPDGSMVLRTAITDTKAGSVLPVLKTGETRASVRIRGQASTVIGGIVDRIWPAGTRELSSIQFSAVTGGELLTDPKNVDTALETFTLVDILPESNEGLFPGRRARVRLVLEPSTLLSRVVRRVNQFIDGRQR